MGKDRPQSTRMILDKCSEKVMKCIAQTGVISQANARSLGANNKLLHKMVTGGYLKSATALVRDRLIKVYRLDSSGVNWVKNYTLIECSYRSNSRQIEHDLKLSEIYCGLPENECETWQNENEIIKNWQKLTGKEIERTDAVDAIITQGKDRIAIEITTDNYGPAERERKAASARLLGCVKIEFIDRRQK